MELTNLQKEKVEELLSLYNPQEKVKIDFKAPTGSGKTLMATAFISELIEQNINDKFVFVIATPSSSELPEAFKEKILQYKNDLSFSDFYVEHIKSPSETGENKLKTDGTIKIIPEQNKIYIFGSSSFGRNRILTTRHIIDDFVDIIHDKGYKLIYIRDEAHIGGNIQNNENLRRFETLMQESAQLVIKMTATPDYKDQSVKKVILTEEDLNNPLKNEDKYLLKTTPELLLKGTMNSDDMLSNAIVSFKEVKRNYQKLEDENIYIRPAMLIQVNNDSNTNTEESIQFNKELKHIKEELTNNGLSWAQYFGNSDKDSNRIYRDNFTLEDITANNSDIDVIIFKVGPATGWDIPRACMLLQLRRVCSDGLKIQTIGRIKRNCYPNLQKNEITDKYYIYSNAPLDRNLQIFNAKVKDEFKNEEFMSIEIKDIKECSKKTAEKDLKEDLLNYLNDNKNRIIQSIKDTFPIQDNEIVYRDIIATAQGAQYVSDTSNVYKFIKIYNKIKIREEKLFKHCEKILFAFWKENLKDYNLNILGNKTFNCSKEMFYLTLIKSYRNEIINLINKNKQYKTQYKVVSSPYKPDVYTEIYTNVPYKVKTTRIDTYMFDTELNGKRNYQPIGQNENSPESIVFNSLEELDADEKCIKVWGKNFTTSNVNSAYLDKYNNIHHSFFDFVVKFNNNVLLYIEVKGEKDINPEKTEMLKGAYKEYFEKQNRSIFDKPVVIAIFKVDTTTGRIHPDCFYDESQFDINLKDLKFKELIEVLQSKNTFEQ